MLDGWRVYEGKLNPKKIPFYLEVRTYDNYPNLVFVKNKIIKDETRNLHGFGEYPLLPDS